MSAGLYRTGNRNVSLLFQINARGFRQQHSTPVVRITTIIDGHTRDVLNRRI